MAGWLEPFKSFDNENSIPVGMLEGDVLDLRKYVDRHAMKWHLGLNSGTPAYTLRLEGEWQVGQGWMTLAEVDQNTAPLQVEQMLVVEGKPCRSLRAVIVVTSGVIGANVSVTSEAL